MRLSTNADALRVMDGSKNYGLAMFPEQVQGEEAAEVGEQLAKERAKESRKLLEERGEANADVDVKRQVEREHRLARKAKGSDKGHSAAKIMGKGTRKANTSRSETGLREEVEHVLRKGTRKAFTKTPDPH
ncbi:hypothetical protein JB92DRAFT_2880673 [Gautieria morchelliformis]|nr:hypothetical protein JB92DRAFT_2880673 [Gautieria morchelliformis]